MYRPKIIKTVVWGDNHAPFMDKPSHNAIYDFVKNREIHNHVHIGDCLDLYSISRWATEDFRGQVDHPIQAGLIQLAQHFNYLRAISPRSRIIWILGNHDDRLDKFSRKYPAWTGITDNIKLLLSAVGGCTVTDDIEIVNIELPQDDFIIGKMHFCHGYYVGKYCAAKHVEEFEANVCHGHAHTMQMYSKARKGVPRAGFSVGHLCSDEGMKYVKGKPTRAVRGFGYMEHVEPGGDFTMCLIPIINGKFIFDGLMYGAKKNQNKRGRPKKAL